MGLVEVVDKEFDKTVRFDDLEIGETFRFDGNIYLKLTKDRDAFSFQSNMSAVFGNRCGVIPVKCKLIVEG